VAERAVIPAWVKADHRRVVDLHWMAHELATQLNSWHAQGQLAALGWVVSNERAPMTHRTDQATSQLARAESWVALCVAAGDGLPTADEWARLEVEPRAVFVADHDFAHGAWRTLAWLLGVYPDPPTELLPARDPDGNLISDREPRYGLRRDESSPLWRRVDRAWRARNRAEAQRWSAHVRRQLGSAENATAPGRA
jgi:hypothetical protein